MNHSAIAAPRRQRHDVSISGREGRFSPQTQGLTPHAIPPDGRSKQDDPNLPPASASRWLLEPGDESDTVSADGNDGAVTAHQPQTPLLSKLREAAIIVGAKVGAVPLFPLRSDHLDVPMPQPFQVVLDEGADADLPSLFKMVARRNVAWWGHVSILPALDNSRRGRLEPMTTPINGTALVLEGGGMRAAYTSAVVVKLLALGWEFPQVSGISAGSSLTANYISRDPERTRLSFTDFAADPRFGNVGTWLAGRGYFHAEYIYQRTAGPHQALPFDFDTFCASRQALRIGATRTSDGKPEWFTRKDITTLDDLMVRVRASSTMPGFMPPVTIDGVEYVDGAIGDAGGIPIDAAQLDGYDRFFVVCTRTRDYVKSEIKRPRAIHKLFRRRPAVAEAIISRPAKYNATREMLRDLETDGKAYVFYPRVMPVTNKEKDVTKLRQAYALGMAQVNAELPKWRDFLGI